MSLLILKVDLTQEEFFVEGKGKLEDKGFKVEIEADKKAAEALSEDFIFKIEEVKKPYSHSVLVKPNDYEKQEDILVNDLGFGGTYKIEQQDVSLDSAYFDALEKVKETDFEISFLLGRYNKTLKDEGQKEAKMFFTKKDGIEDLSKRLEEQVKELNGVINDSLEQRIESYITMLQGEIDAVKVKKPEDIPRIISGGMFSEEESIEPAKKDSVLNIYYRGRKDKIETTLDTILKMIKRLTVPEEKDAMTETEKDRFLAKKGAKETLFTNHRDLREYLSRPREGTPFQGPKEKHIDTRMLRHKKTLNKLSRNMITILNTHYDRENELKDQLNRFRILIGKPELEIPEKGLEVKDTTLKTTKKMADAIKYKGSLADFIKKTLLEKDENTRRRNNQNIRKKIKVILGEEIPVINSRISFLEDMKADRTKIATIDIKKKKVGGFQEKETGAGIDSTRKYTEVFAGYNELMDSGRKINQELNKKVDRRTLYEYLVDYSNEKGASYVKGRTRKIRGELSGLSKDEKRKKLGEITRLRKQSPLIKKYKFDKLQNLLLSDYGVIEEAIDEMKTRGITDEKFFEELTEDGFVRDYIEKIGSTYFPNLPPTFYPMSEGQKLRIYRLLIKNIKQFTNKVGKENLTVDDAVIEDLIQQFNREQGNVEEE